MCRCGVIAEVKNGRAIVQRYRHGWDGERLADYPVRVPRLEV
jgi:hypothetical protein